MSFIHGFPQEGMHLTTYPEYLGNENQDIVECEEGIEDLRNKLTHSPLINQGGSNDSVV